MIHFRLRYETVRNTLAAQRAVLRRLRAAWRAAAALSVALLIAAGVARLTGRPPAVWLWGAVGGLSLLVGLGSWLHERLGDAREASAVWLDGRLGLGELLVTAVEVDRRGPRTSPERRLLDDAATALAERADARSLRGDQVRREVEAVIAAALILLGIGLSWGWLRGLPPGSQLGPLALGGRGRAPGAGWEDVGSDTSGAGLGLAALAGAWTDHAALHPAATALERDDAPAAARALRVLADRAPELSESGARELAAALAQSVQAHRATGGGQPLATALEQAGQRMRSQRPSEQSAALEELARWIEREGEAAGGAPGASRDALRQRAGPAAERLASGALRLTVVGEGEGGVSAAEAALGARSDGNDGPDDGPAGTDATPPGVLDPRQIGAGSSPDAADRLLGVGARLNPAEQETVARFFRRGSGSPTTGNADALADPAREAQP